MSDIWTPGGGPPAFGADFVTPQGLYTIDASGRITGIVLPVAPFSSSLRWVRVSDGNTIGSIAMQAFGTAPNRQNNLQLLATEPVDTGASAGASIAAVVSAAALGQFSETILSVNDLFGAFPQSDFLLKERLTFSLWSGAPIGFVVDSNFRIYNLGGGVVFQNSSKNPTSPWNGAGAVQCPLNPHGGYIFWCGQQGGVSGASLGTFVVGPGGGVPIYAGSNAVTNFASSPGNSNNSTVSWMRQNFLDAINWGGWNSSTTPAAFLGIFSVPFDSDL